MKVKKGIVVLAILGLVFTACKKEKQITELEKFDSEYASFSELTVEQNKSKLEDNGLEVMSQLDDLKNDEMMDVMAQLEEFPDPFSDDQVVAIKPLTILPSYKNNEVEGNEVFAQLKSTMVDEPIFTNEWNEVVGRYSWNPTKKDWDYSKLTDAVVIEFPGKEGDQTNTAKISVNNFAVVKVNPAQELELGTTELPVSLSASLTYKTKALATYAFTASYRSDALPLEVKASLNVGLYSLSAAYTNTPDTKISTLYSLKKADKIIAETFAQLNGNWTEQNLEAIENWEAKEGDAVLPVELILSKANAYMQVMNIKVAGVIDFKGIEQELEDHYKNYESKTDKEEVDQIVKIVNSHIKLVVVFADTKKVIAKAEMYADEDEWGYYYLDMRFIFADGSKSDIETYVENGFANLETEIDAFIDEIESKFEEEVKK